MFQSLVPGDLISVHGLARRDLNGTMGKVVQSDPMTDTFTVALETDEKISVRRPNIKYESSLWGCPLGLGR